MKYAYTFDQLRGAPEAADRLFLSYESTVRQFGAVDQSRYFTADFGVVEAENETEACERLFRAYNSDVRPEGYEGRSMSVGDIVTLWDNDREPPVKTVWFCDSVGFVQLSRTMEAARMCPICGRAYTDSPALSRRDNESAICPDCGTREALEDMRGGGRA